MALDTGVPIGPTYLPISLANNVTFTKNYAEAVQHVQLTLAGVVINVSDSSGEYGGTAIMTLQDRNVLILNAEANLTMVKGNATNGIGATDDFDFGVGTATASNNTLSTTMQNIIPKTTVTTDALSVSFQASMFSAVGTGAAFLSVPDGPTNIVYLNAASGGSVMTADDTITATGTIDLWFIDLGNITS